MENEYLFKFLEYAQVVILTVLLMETSKSIINAGEKSLNIKYLIKNFRFILQLLALLIFLELYIVLYKYHKEIGVTYKCLFLFIDLFLISLPFIILVQIINESWTKEYLLKTSIGMFAFLFSVILLRQGFCYLFSLPQGKTISIDLKISMYADIFGIVMSIIAYFIPKAIRFWSHFGFGLFTAYFILTRLITVSIKLQ